MVSRVSVLDLVQKKNPFRGDGYPLQKEFLFWRGTNQLLRVPGSRKHLINPNLSSQLWGKLGIFCDKVN